LRLMPRRPARARAVEMKRAWDKPQEPVRAWLCPRRRFRSWFGEGQEATYIQQLARVRKRWEGGEGRGGHSSGLLSPGSSWARVPEDATCFSFRSNSDSTVVPLLSTPIALNSTRRVMISLRLMPSTATSLNCAAVSRRLGWRCSSGMPRTRKA